jgi:SHS2 domain-containing protein
VTYEWIDHTAELELRIDAPTEEAVFADALAAFAELVATAGAGEPVHVPVQVEGTDRAALLVGWLEELVYLADVDAIEPEGAAELDISDRRLHAVVQGHVGAPRPFVKAVTYHRAEFEPDDSGWRARVVLDV